MRQRRGQVGGLPGQQQGLRQQGLAVGRQPPRREEGPFRWAQEGSDGGLGLDTRHWELLRIQLPPSFKHYRVRVGTWWREQALGAIRVGALWIADALVRAKAWRLRAKLGGVLLVDNQEGALVAPAVTQSHPRPLEEEGGGGLDRPLAATGSQTAAVLQAEHLSAQPRVLVPQRQELTFPHQVAELPLLSGPLGGLVVLEPLVSVLGVLLLVGGHLPLAARPNQAAAGAKVEETLSQERVARHRVGDPWIWFHEGLGWTRGGGGDEQGSRFGATRPPQR